MDNSIADDVTNVFNNVSSFVADKSEYLVMLMDPYSRKSRYEVVERISSNIQARDNYRNIELEKN
jgi:polyphosphate kinase